MLRSSRITVALAAAVLLPSPALSQGQFPETNGASLKGITSFDAQFVADTWLNIEVDEERFEARGQAAFERGVRGSGVTVDTGAPNYLFCVISAAQSGDIIFYHYSVDYHLFSADGIQPLEWTAAGVVSIGEADFTAEEAASDCVETFSTEWRSQNPG